MQDDHGHWFNGQYYVHEHDSGSDDEHEHDEHDHIQALATLLASKKDMPDEEIQAALQGVKDKEQEEKIEQQKVLRDIQEKKRAMAQFEQGGKEQLQDMDQEGNFDWTRKYDAMSKFEDVDELERRETEERKKMEGKKGGIGPHSHDHAKERELMDKPNKDKIKESRQFQNHGNMFFKEGQVCGTVCCDLFSFYNRYALLSSSTVHACEKLVQQVVNLV
jgi:hypothetical protein